MPIGRAPKVFVSYSHDDREHKDWVLNLSTRLVANGVDVILDQWDLRLGSDLPRFMESGLTEADRVLAVCTDSYVEKANAGTGGVGYEKMILTAELMQNVRAEKIIPVILGSGRSQPLPTFLGARVYIDFRDPVQYEAKYVELIREIHGLHISPRPQLGENPFTKEHGYSSPSFSMSPERYVSPALSGKVTFDYSNNNGRYFIGSGDMAFELAWSRASNTAIHAYTDPPSIRSIALAVGVQHVQEIHDASSFDTSSRVRTPRLGEFVIWQNTAGYFAVVQIQALKSRSHGDACDEVTFTYFIQPNRTASFTEVSQ